MNIKVAAFTVSEKSSNTNLYEKSHRLDDNRTHSEIRHARNSVTTQFVNPRDIFDRRLFEVVFVCELKEVKFSIG